MQSPSYSHPPVYCPQFGDSVRVGGFVNLEKNPFISSIHPHPNTPFIIGRVISNTPDIGVVISLFLPLFTTPSNTAPVLATDSNMEKTPKHANAPLSLPPGSTLTELYDTNRLIVVLPEIVKHISFVFSLQELQDSSNCWVSSLDNVFVCRFRRCVTTQLLVDIGSTSIAFAAQHHQEQNCLNPVLRQPRCLHHVVWMGIFTV